MTSSLLFLLLLCATLDPSSPAQDSSTARIQTIHSTGNEYETAGERLCESVEEEHENYSTYRGVEGYLCKVDCGALYFFTVMMAQEHQRRVTADDDMEGLLSSSDPMIYVEVGSFRGLSALVVETAARSMNVPVLIYAHDHFDLDPHHFESFYSTIITHNLRQTIIPIRGLSEKTLKIHSKESVSLVFIDGDHTYESALSDITLAWEILRAGGYMIGHDCIHFDDAAESYEILGSNKRKVNGVRRALLEFLNERNLSAFSIQYSMGMFVLPKQLETGL